MEILILPWSHLIKNKLTIANFNNNVYSVHKVKCTQKLNFLTCLSCTIIMYVIISSVYKYHFFAKNFNLFVWMYNI